MNESSPTEEDILRIFLIAILKNCCKVFFGKFFFRNRPKKLERTVSLKYIHLLPLCPRKFFCNSNNSSNGRNSNNIFDATNAPSDTNRNICTYVGCCTWAAAPSDSKERDLCSQKNCK